MFESLVERWQIFVILAAITGGGFIAKDIGFHNNAVPQGKQAIAFTLASDRSVLYRCSIAGYQDTLYALILQQFGNAAAVFQDCDLIFRQPGSRKSYNVDQWTNLPLSEYWILSPEVQD